MWIETVRDGLSVRAIVPWLLVLSGLMIQLLGAGLMLRNGREEMSARVTPSPRAIPVESGSKPPELVEVPTFAKPIPGLPVPTNPNLLPGAVRSYRGGRHEGVDFSCKPGTEVLAAEAGWILSVDDRSNLPKVRRDELLAYCTRMKLTPPEVLWVLHGRRIVICHGIREGRLLTTSYSHLSSIRSVLKPGDAVERGEVIGTAGNSGTSHAYSSDGWGELPIFEIHLNGEPLGCNVGPSTAGDLYRAAFAAQ